MWELERPLTSNGHPLGYSSSGQNNAPYGAIAWVRGWQHGCPALQTPFEIAPYATHLISTANQSGPSSSGTHASRPLETEANKMEFFGNRGISAKLRTLEDRRRLRSGVWQDATPFHPFAGTRDKWPKNKSTVSIGGNRDGMPEGSAPSKALFEGDRNEQRQVRNTLTSIRRNILTSPPKSADREWASRVHPDNETG